MIKMCVLKEFIIAKQELMRVHARICVNALIEIHQLLEMFITEDVNSQE